MAKQTEITRGISPGFTEPLAVKYLEDVKRGLYGKLPNAAGIDDASVILLAAFDGVAGALAAQLAAQRSITPDKLRVFFLQRMAEYTHRTEGEVRDLYTWNDMNDTGDNE